ncbi:hypothetical protein [Halobacterium sp. R2-5]|uniref:hypothetical protein n=1 Tax=Halobacterium sp. R2-5 TaxID=2715751 RepID=UPI00141F497E|nr:hypothetical protein [Halobacterium sp. R2-5]NIC00995.1 hypothetical protein [Halobacterium sp. R2-5]
MGENEQPTLSRRRLLAGIGVAGSSALAGCGGSSNAEVGESSDKDVPAPEVDAVDRWTLKTPNSEPRLLLEGSAAFVVDYTAHGHTVRYEDTHLRERIKEDTFGEIDRPFAVAFASRVDVFPSHLSIATRLKNGEIRKSIRDHLTSAMREFGVQNIQTDGTMDASNTSAGEFPVVRGEYPLEEVTISGVDIPHSDQDELTFGGGTLPIKGIAGRWKSNGSILAGGGVYPADDFEDSQNVSMSDAIELSVSVDLDMGWQQREQDVLDFVQSISR